MGCIMLFAYFNNGDGLMGIKNKRDPSGYSAQRLYLTDSGHYIMPIDNFGKGADRGSNKHLKSVTDKVRRSAKAAGWPNDKATAADLVVSVMTDNCEEFNAGVHGDDGNQDFN